MAIQKFTARALDVLDRIYSIVGSISRVDAIDVAPPVLVHDVSREAEVSVGFYANASVSITTAGAGAQTFASLTRDAFLAQTTVRALMVEKGFEPSDVDVWILSWWALVATADIGNYGTMRIGLTFGNNAGTGPSMIVQAYNQLEAPIISGGTTLLRSDADFQNPAFGRFTAPCLMPDSPATAFLVVGNDDAGGAMTAGPVFRCWIGPKGCLPPGA